MNGTRGTRRSRWAFLLLAFPHPGAFFTSGSLSRGSHSGTHLTSSGTFPQTSLFVLSSRMRRSLSMITCHERTCTRTRSVFAILFDRMFVLSLPSLGGQNGTLVSSIIALSESLSTTSHSTIIFLILCSRWNNRPRISKCRMAFCTWMMDT